MFNFGNPEDTAELFYQQALAGNGPLLPDCHWDEMEESDLRNAFVYLYRSVRSAYEEGADLEVLRVLVKEYDEVFTALVEVSGTFREAVLRGKHEPVLGFTREQVDKYKGMARS